MNRATARIIHPNTDARNVAASAARMSTQSGTALEIFERSGDPEKDLRLLSKVLASGHRSVIEHQTFGIALNDVSVFVEQFLIEFRLASFTVKSRRYVDFTDAGFVIPEPLSEAQRVLFTETMNARFADYRSLLELDIPKEDARFVLPYALRSNFFMTVNARELIYMIQTMLYGRGSKYPEIRALGVQLKAQFDELYPGILQDCDSSPRQPTYIAADEIRQGSDRVGSAELIGAPENAKALLEMCSDGVGPEALVQSERPRALEMLNYTFRIRNCSLACLTHFTRHRMQSPIIPDVVNALKGGCYVLPETIRANAKALQRYLSAFSEQYKAARKAIECQISEEVLSYFCLSGHEIDFIMTLNAREFMHFCKLRTCRRAQWEIRGIARAMLRLADEQYPELFDHFGPSCLVTGKCPEGRMSCGHPVRREELR